MKRKRYKSEKFKNSMFRNPQMKKFIGVQDQGFRIEIWERYVTHGGIELVLILGGGNVHSSFLV